MVMGFALGGSFVSAFLYNDPSSNHGPSVLWQKLWTDPNATFAGAVAVFTLALVIVGAWQARRLRQTVEATEKAVAETRRIGEAEVRAYVHIYRTVFESWHDDRSNSIQDRVSVHRCF